jgi:hydrogenase maturation protease
MKPRRVAVLGLGNVLMGDDGFGPYLAQFLRAAYELPEGLSVQELGTPGFDLVPHLAGLDAVIILDAVQAPALPGDVRVYRRDQILRHAPGPRVSPHDPALKEALLLADLAGEAPKEVILVGVVPARVTTGVGLSVPVRAALPTAVAEVVGHLAALGFRLRPRHPPALLDVWWEQAATGLPPLRAAGPGLR